MAEAYSSLLDRAHSGELALAKQYPPKNFVDRCILDDHSFSLDNKLPLAGKLSEQQERKNNTCVRKDQE